MIGKRDSQIALCSVVLKMRASNSVGTSVSIASAPAECPLQKPRKMSVFCRCALLQLSRSECTHKVVEKFWYIDISLSNLGTDAIRDLMEYF